jgi:DNA repair exonuclease SbcCD ATPase subunit
MVGLNKGGDYAMKAAKASKVLATRHPQFKCPFCGKGFEQKSKLSRHTETAHPPSAPSAADLERLLGAIKYPKSKQELQSFATQRISMRSSELLILVSFSSRPHL